MREGKVTVKKELAKKDVMTEAEKRDLLEMLCCQL